MKSSPPVLHQNTSNVDFLLRSPSPAEVVKVCSPKYALGMVCESKYDRYGLFLIVILPGGLVVDLESKGPWNHSRTAIDVVSPIVSLFGSSHVVPVCVLVCLLVSSNKVTHEMNTT